jgi:hypothetical protein
MTSGTKKDTDHQADLDRVREAMVERAHQQATVTRYTATYSTYQPARASAGRYRGRRTVTKVVNSTDTGGV